MKPPIFNKDALTRLAERTEYEAWLLEAIYRIAAQELFPKEADSVIYPLSGPPKFIAWLRGNSNLGDWRPGFLDVGAPLVFITTFKLLDMFIEWVLFENGLPVDFRFQQKLDRLKSPLEFPEFVERRSWLRERLIGFYARLEPLRGTIIHERHFVTANGDLTVASSKRGIVGLQIHIPSADLRVLARIAVSVLRYVDGSWVVDQYRERFLRHDLDCLVDLHSQPLLKQSRPYSPTVRVFSTEPDLRTFNIAKIASDLASKYPTNDCMFDLRYLTVRGHEVVDAYLIPWEHLQAGTLSALADADRFRVDIPSDIDPTHIQSGAG